MERTADGHNTKISEATEAKHTEILPLLPLRDVVVFPFMVLPLFIGRKTSLEAVSRAMEGKRQIFLATQRNPKTDEPQPEELYLYGCVAEILQMIKLPDGTVKILVEGVRRARVIDFIPHEDYISAKVEDVDESTELTMEIQALMRSVTSLFEQYVKLNQKIPIEIMMVIVNTEEPARLADIVAAHLLLNVNMKQEVLEAVDVKERLERLVSILAREIEILTIEKKIKERVKDQVEGMQREHYLREQLKAIQRELGIEQELSDEISEYREKLASLKVDEDVRKRIEKEISRLERMAANTAEMTVARNYLDWVLSLPWSNSTVDNRDIKRSAEILEEDHYGLEDVKERMIEFLAVRQLVEKMRGPILCLVGPPGVGKTSLGKSIARALNRKFVRMSLGGMHDEAEIRGHRRTYIGAMPGRIIQGLKQAGTKNPVFLLDEIDKLTRDFRGDPASALLEVLDPEQNSTFTDNYIGLPFDLSDVLFITTANVTHTIPAPLLDRMEVITIPGYMEHEKVEIARNFLFPKKRKENGIEENEAEITADALKYIIRRYTREAGVRGLERELDTILRKLAREKVEGKLKGTVRITRKRVEKMLGAPRFSEQEKARACEVGTANGLAWTAVGGSVMRIEAVKMQGKGMLELTGQIGDVMQESARTAMSYIKSKARELKIPDSIFETTDIHVHIPEGATPKDGPSAGVALATALISLLTGRPTRPDIAMTGEITLRGNVLVVGGIKEKILAAIQVGIKEICMPAENRKDLEKIPDALLKNVKLTFVKTLDEVINRALVDCVDVKHGS